MTPNEVNFSSFHKLDENKLTELKELCKENGLQIWGKNAIPRTRLEEHYAWIRRGICAM